jgi:hypothetical protein
MHEAGDPYLYRIVPFRHLIDLFESKELHFAPASAWEDPYERILQHKGTNWTFAQCWCRRAVSDAMWRIYSPDRTAVRIRTSRSKLIRLGSRINASHHCTFRLDEVTYLPTRAVDLEMDRIAGLLRTRFNPKLALDALFLKRDAFDFEAELRAIVYLKAQSRAQPQAAFRFRFDPHSFLESILFDPRADETYVKVVAHYLKYVLKYEGTIGRSALYRAEPIHIPDEA